MPKGTRIRVCLTLPTVSQVKKYFNGTYVGNISVSQLQPGVYCAVETLDTPGAYGYVALNEDGGYDVLNLHVYDPATPPQTITTYLLVTHEQGNPPTRAILVGPTETVDVSITEIEPGISLVGPTRLEYGAYWLKLIWSDGMELVVPLFFRALIPEAVKKAYWLAKRSFLMITLMLTSYGRRFVLGLPG